MIATGIVSMHTSSAEKEDMMAVLVRAHTSCSVSFYYTFLFHLSAPVAYTDSFFGDGVYPIVWSNVKCNGWEKSFDDCTKSTYLNFWCTRARVAGVLCAEGLYTHKTVTEKLNHSLLCILIL